MDAEGMQNDDTYRVDVIDLYTQQKPIALKGLKLEDPFA